MDSSEWAHLKFSRFLLESFGLWPDQSKFTKRRNYLIFVTWSLSLTLPLIQALVEMSDWNVILFFGTTVAIGYILGGLSLATLMYIKSHRLSRLYEQIETDMSGITHDEKLLIMDQFSRQAGFLIYIFTGMAIFAILMFMTSNYLPLIFSSAHDYSEMFSIYSNRWIIYESLRRPQVIVHISLEAIYAALMYVASVSVYIFSVKHTCGMYAIVSYRLQRVMELKKVGSGKRTKDEKEIIAELLDVVAKHREAIESAQIVERVFSRVFYGVQIGVEMCLGILIFGLELSIHIKSAHLAFRVFSMGAIIIMYIFYLNYGGEQIIKFSNKVFTTTYYVNWDVMPTEARKILSMIILRSSKSETLRGGTMTLSLRNFSTIMYISWSMAAVLLSTQKES